MFLRGDDRLCHQGDDGHRPNPAWNRRDRPGDLLRRCEIHITDQTCFAVIAFDAINADIDDGCPGFYPVTLDHLRSAYCRYQDIGAPALLRQILSA